MENKAIKEQSAFVLIDYPQNIHTISTDLSTIIYLFIYIEVETVHNFTLDYDLFT